jgi:hypothetical protein
MGCPALQEQHMATKPKRSEPAQSDNANEHSLRDQGWDERLRLVGDARFVEVEWSGRDHPCWPLPKK